MMASMPSNYRIGNRSRPRLVALVLLLVLGAMTGADALLPAQAQEAQSQENGDGAQRGDRPATEPAGPLEPFRPGFEAERFGEVPSDASNRRVLMPPFAMSLPGSLRSAPTAETAFGIFQRGHYLTALDTALPLAEAGDAAAQTLVAEIFAEGFGVPRSLEQASFWYGQAAEGGNSTAQYKYALMLLSGRYAEHDMERARELMEAAARSGNAAAQFNYGQMLVNEMRGQRGLTAALPYFEAAAEKGIPDAQYALSQIYINSDEVEEEKQASARDWLEKAAHAGFDTAQLDLAIWLIDGIGGAHDYEEGFGWMERAALGGNVIAQNRLTHLYIHAIGTRPNPVEAGKWYVLSRRAGLEDGSLNDFFRGLTDEEQRQSIEAANRFRP